MPTESTSAPHGRWFYFGSVFSSVLVVIVLLAGIHRTVASKSNSVDPEDRFVSQVDSLPMVLPDSMIRPLRLLVDAEFQTKLNAVVSSNSKWSRLVRNKKLAIGLVDLRNPYEVKFARVNGNEMMYAASLPKIAVLLATMDALEGGQLEDSEEIRNDMRLMISVSDNAASTRLIDKLGYDKIASVLQDPRYELYDENFGGGLWVGKRYAQTGPRRGDPLKNISHAATASQVARYYYLLAFGKLVSYERSSQMLDILTDPELHHKFVNTLDTVAPTASVFRKSGSWRTYHSDSVLVWGSEWRRYILVALIDDADGEKILRNLILEVDNMLAPPVN